MHALRVQIPQVNVETLRENESKSFEFQINDLNEQASEVYMTYSKRCL